MAKDHLITIDVDTATGAFTYTENGTSVNRLHVSRSGDTVNWTVKGDNPWAIDFGARTPCNRRRSKKTSKKGSQLKVSPKAQADTYKYYVAVAKAGDVFLDDPEVVVDPEE